MERWLPLVGFDGYEISDLGRFRSTDKIVNFSDGRVRHYKSKILKQYVNPTRGYYQISLVVNRKHKTVYTHIQVAKTFLVKENPDHWVLHKVNDKSNNAVSNLYYGTPSENMFDKQKDGTDHNRNKTHCPRGHKLEKPNLVVCALKNNHRICLACSRAAGVLRKGKTMQEISDEKYMLILGLV